MWSTLKNTNNGYYGIEQFVDKTRSLEAGADSLEEGTFTKDDDFEAMLLNKSTLSRLVKDFGRKPKSRIENDVRQDTYYILYII